MSIQSLRIATDHICPWTLHGPVDQALKTSIQAPAVRVFPLSASLYDTTLEVELWVAADTMIFDRAGMDEMFNPVATAILQYSALREKDLPPRGIEIGRRLHAFGMQIVGNTTIVRGAAILTGAGASDIDKHHIEYVILALIGRR